jgi:hypothetical protein
MAVPTLRSFRRLRQRRRPRSLAGTDFAERGAVRFAGQAVVRCELDSDGELRTQLASRDDVRAFGSGFAARALRPGASLGPGT